MPTLTEAFLAVVLDTVSVVPAMDLRSITCLALVGANTSRNLGLARTRSLTCPAVAVPDHGISTDAPASMLSTSPPEGFSEPNSLTRYGLTTSM